MAKIKNALGKTMSVKAHDYVVVRWNDAPDEIAYVVNPRPEKECGHADLMFFRGKQSRITGTNHDQIVCVVPSVKVCSFEHRIVDLPQQPGTMR